MNIVNASVRFVSLLVKRVYFGASKTPWRLSTTRSAVSLTLCSTLPVFVQVVLQKLSLWLVRTADGRTVASSFSLNIRNTQEIRKHGTVTETSFSMRMSWRGSSNPGSDAASDGWYARFGGWCGQDEGRFVWGIQEFYWSIKSDKPARQMWKWFHQWLNWAQGRPEMR